MNPPNHEERARRAHVARTQLDDAAARRIAARLHHSMAPRQGLPWLWVAGPGLAVALVWFVITTLVTRADAQDPVTIVLEGEGTLEGTERDPRLAWTDGVAHIHVEPNRGVTFTVTTDEATVRVVGTTFDVYRENHATQVVVEHGRVGVTCQGQPERFLVDDERTTCLPRDLPTLLKRTTALQRQGAAPAERLATIAVAEAHATDDDPMTATLRGELLAHRIDALQDDGDEAGALAAAERYLANAHRPRRKGLLTYVARTRFERDGCAARPVLETAAAELPAGPEWLLLASCLVDASPTRARALLDAARPEVSGDLAALANRLQEALGQEP